MIKIPIRGVIWLLVCSLIGCEIIIDETASESPSNILNAAVFKLTILHLNDTHSFIKGDHFNLSNDAISLNS
ncbi:MAG: hypothetical protein CMK36_01045, partial [Porticoccaceae bacterium]|nr:hypothetical protein [Porticoccaceae bacterium]